MLTVGAASTEAYTTAGGVGVHRTTVPVDPHGVVDPIIDALDERRGVLLASSFEYPGRYARWTIGLVDPPLQIVSRGRSLSITALNDRGRVLLPALRPSLDSLDAVAGLEVSDVRMDVEVKPPAERVTEEDRSRQHSVFSVLRAIIQCFGHDAEPHLGLYGAFGYDLAFQFDPIDFRIDRPADRRDLVLFLPDDIVVVDGQAQRAIRCQYEFEAAGMSTQGLPREGERSPFAPPSSTEPWREYPPGGYAELVRLAHERFRRGDLFEVVPSQMFFQPCTAPPSEIFRRLQKRNPAPYGAFINLGEQEYLVGASPEMYVRAEGRRIETCPISGTISRGESAIDDADQILKLLMSQKDATELTMCTDVDRNDKSRICVPGSVRVIGRRQVELYSRLIHTVDHVEGMLQEGYDPLDAFLSHAWAVTVTGAPKLWAMRFIEEHERSYRAWYGGALGVLGFDGSVNTGLTLRTTRIKNGVAEVRAGATLLYDSVPEDEEKETELKAAAIIDAITRPEPRGPESAACRSAATNGKRVLMLDHEDSFVQTLVSYVREQGAEVKTLRAGLPDEALRAELADYRPSLVMLSPGPGCPADFQMSRTLSTVLDLGIPVFGVCLGLQGIVEHFGGELGILPEAMHGKSSEIRTLGGTLLEGLPETFEAGRYHSLYAKKDTMPEELVVTAESSDGVVMAIEHAILPIGAVQFHPESIMTLKLDAGSRLIRNVLSRLAR